MKHDQEIPDLRRPRPELPAPADRRRLRLAAGHSLLSAGVLIGVDPSSLSRWERGVVEPIGPARQVYGEFLAKCSGEGE